MILNAGFSTLYVAAAAAPDAVFAFGFNFGNQTPLVLLSSVEFWEEWLHRDRILLFWMRSHLRVQQWTRRVRLRMSLGRRRSGRAGAEGRSVCL